MALCRRGLREGGRVLEANAKYRAQKDWLRQPDGGDTDWDGVAD